MQDEPTIYEDKSGNKRWYIAGKLHRIDGPAVEYANGSKAWYLAGRLHRVDGPAIEWVSGGVGWYLDGKLLTKEEWFNSLSPGKKEKALFSEFFILG